MTVLAHSPTWNGPPNLPITNIDTFPDALIPFIDPATGKPPAGGTYSAAPLNVTAVHNAVFWVHVVIPRDAMAGDYLGIYTVTRDEGPAVGLIHVHVWNFTLRREPYLKSSFEGSGVYSPGLREALLRNDLVPDTVKLQDESRFINRYGLNAADLGFWSNASYAAWDASAPPSLGAVESARATPQPGLLLYHDTADPKSSSTSDDFYHAMIRWAQSCIKLE